MNEARELLNNYGISFSLKKNFNQYTITLFKDDQRFYIQNWESKYIEENTIIFINTLIKEQILIFFKYSKDPMYNYIHDIAKEAFSKYDLYPSF